MQQRQSRLSRATAEQTKKQIVFFIIAILVILFIAVQFGPKLLSYIAGLTNQHGTAPNSISQESNTLEAPVIDSIPTATDSASIIITGSSVYSDAQVELYVNNSLVDTQPLTKDQKFSFTNVELTPGQNIIQAKIKKGNDASNFTRTYYVTYSQGTPKLDISTPSDNQQFKRGDQTITIQGTTDPGNMVTINGFRAIVDQSGNFSYNMDLTQGDNNLDIIAQSTSGKQTEKKLKVTYSP